ncbi:MAG: DUF4276 family protein [Chloroflexi bacterium]|nr:DUF4276 family protein [Chloroflexota bacterium]
MVRVSIYIEGGGDSAKLNQIFCTGWRDFFTSAGLTGRLPAVVRCGDRANAFRRFSVALREAGDNELPILLVDSEGPVKEGQSTWEYLRDNDGWRPPAGAYDNQAYLMVQAMEAWLMVDRDALRDYFGRGFNENRLPGQSDPEQIPQNTLESSLKDASAGCGRQYVKGPVSFEILGRVDADKVKERCSHAKILLDHLRSL